MIIKYRLIKSLLLLASLSVFWQINPLAMEAHPQQEQKNKTVLSHLAERGRELEYDIIGGVAKFLPERYRKSLCCVCKNYYVSITQNTNVLIDEYRQQVESLMKCNTVSELTAEHVEFFLYTRNSFPLFELFNTPIFENLTALHLAILTDHDVATMFLLALDVDLNTTAMIQDPSNPNVTISKTCLQLLNEKNKPYWTKYFKDRPRKTRMHDLASLYDLARTQNTIYTESSGEHHLAIDFLLNYPKDTIDLYPDADFGPLMLVIIASEGLRDLVFSRKIISTNLIEKMIRILIHHAFESTGTDKDIEDLKWLLLNRGDASVYADNGESSSWSLLLHRISVATNSYEDSHLRQRKKIEMIVPAMLSAGADPYYQYNHYNTFITNPVSRLLKLALTTWGDDTECAFIVGLLQLCKKYKFQVEVYQEWARNQPCWRFPKLCQHLMESGVDPLMECGDTTPFQQAISWMSENSPLGGDKDAERSLRIMLPYCGDRLKERQIDFCPSSCNGKEKFDLYVELINAGLTCTPWAVKFISWLLVEPQWCQFLIENNQIHPLAEYDIYSLYGPKRMSPIQKALSFEGIDLQRQIESLFVMVEHCKERLIKTPIVLTPQQQKVLKEEDELDYFLENGFTLPTNSKSAG
jgi:hypothetical protein